MTNIVLVAYIPIATLQKRHILNIDKITNNGIVNEWESISLYTSDILLFPLIALIIATRSQNKLLQSNKILLHISLFLLVIVISSAKNGISNHEIYSLLRIAEFILILTYCTSLIKSKYLTAIIATISITAIIQSIIAITQFTLQSSIGLHALGEITINPTIINIAKTTYNGIDMIRPVGTFPHSNVLSYFLGGTLIFLTYLAINVPRGTRAPICSTWNTITTYFNKSIALPKAKKIMFHVEHYFSIALITLALMVSQSRINIITTIICASFGLLYLAYKKNIKSPAAYIILVLAIALPIFSQFQGRTSLQDQNGDMAISLRKIHVEHAIQVITKNPALGVGPGEYTKTFIPPLHMPWLKQPVHNGILLIISEIGLIGFIIGGVVMIYLTYKSKPKLIALTIITFVTITSLTDHYHITIHQGSVATAIFIGISLALSNVPRGTLESLPKRSTRDIN